LKQIFDDFVKLNAKEILEEALALNYNTVKQVKATLEFMLSLSKGEIPTIA
jgi:hypothetical protein